MNEQRHIAAIVHYQLRAIAIRMAHCLIRTPPIFFQRFTLPGENGNARSSNRGRGMILRGENVAARPAHVGAQIHQRLNENGGLNRHVERTRYADALQRLGRRILVADRHQTRHLVLGDRNLFRPQSACAISATLYSVAVRLSVAEPMKFCPRCRLYQRILIC